MAPKGVSLLFARDKEAVAPLLRGLEPDLVLCWGFGWKLPQEALDVARLGSVNHHPALLPRHRGPIPLSWALRENDGAFGHDLAPHGRRARHRRDPRSDDGPDRGRLDDDRGDRARRCSRRRSSSCRRSSSGSRPAIRAIRSRPRASSWAGLFEEDYANVDWSQPARTIHNQVRAWHLSFGMSPVVGPIAELDGERVKLLRTSLTDPGDGARAVECGDGHLWIVESEPAS